MTIDMTNPVALTAARQMMFNVTGYAGSGRTATLVEGSPVESVAFSPDGRTLAAGDLGGNVGLWATSSRADRHPGRRQPGRKRGVQPGRKDARRWRLRRSCRPVGHRQRPADRHPGRRQLGQRCGVQPGRRTLAAGDTGGHVGLWDSTSGRRTASLAEGSLINSVAFSPNGQTLAAGDLGGHVGLWATGSGAPTATLAESSPVTSVAFSPDGQTLAAGDDGGHVGLWDTAAGRADRYLGRGQPGRAVWRSARTARPWRPATPTVMSACGTGERTADRLPRRGQPGHQRGVQPGREDPGRRRLRRRCRLVGRGDRARTASLLVGDRIRSYKRRVQPGRAHLAARSSGDYGGHVGLWDYGTGSGPLPWPRAARSRAWRSARTERRSRSATPAANHPVGHPQRPGGSLPWPRAARSRAWRSARTERRSQPGTTAVMSACGLPAAIGGSLPWPRAASS